MFKLVLQNLLLNLKSDVLEFIPSRTNKLFLISVSACPFCGGECAGARLRAWLPKRKPG
jgi:hypothetical protein